MRQTPSLPVAGWCEGWTLEIYWILLKQNWKSDKFHWKLNNIEFRLCRHSHSLDIRYLWVVSSTYNIPIRELWIRERKNRYTSHHHNMFKRNIIWLTSWNKLTFLILPVSTDTKLSLSYRIQSKQQVCLMVSIYIWHSLQWKHCPSQDWIFDINSILFNPLNRTRTSRLDGASWW